MTSQEDLLESHSKNEDIHSDSMTVLEHWIPANTTIMMHDPTEIGSLGTESHLEGIEVVPLATDRKREEKAVRFDKVYIHEHAITLGSNPGVTRGPPVELSWEAISHLEHSVQALERIQSRKRPRKVLRLSSMERRAALERAGITQQEMLEEELRVEAIQASREAVEDEWLKELRQAEALEFMEMLPSNKTRLSLLGKARQLVATKQLVWRRWFLK